MEIVIRAAGCAVVGSMLALVLRKHTPELSLAVTILAGTAVVWMAATVCASIADVLRQIAREGEVDTLFIAPVLKCIAIGMVSHLAAQICRDAQQGSVASAVELCAALCAVYVSLPLLEALLSLVEKLL